MVVDDDHDLLAVTKMILERNGYMVHGFTDPVEALTHGKDCKECGIVITDLRMPVMNGFQLVRALRESRPEISVVLMTATETNSREWRQTLPSTMVDQFLTKPFSKLQLVEAIEKCVPIMSIS
jgi:CheY-like chemotaxis protein